MLMNDNQMVNEHIKCLEESVTFLQDKEKKESWVVNEFLTNLNIKFEKSEIKKSKDEPPDVIFRTCSFEIKEIYDKDRKRDKEFKEKLKKASKVSNYSENLSLEDYDLQDISIQEIMKSIDEILKDYILSPEQYKNIDMLFYFNRLHCKIDINSQYVSLSYPLWKQWRSVSVVGNNKVNLIFWASNNAPDFLKENMGKMVLNGQSFSN